MSQEVIQALENNLPLNQIVLLFIKNNPSGIENQTFSSEIVKSSTCYAYLSVSVASTKTGNIYIDFFTNHSDPAPLYTLQDSFNNATPLYKIYPISEKFVRVRVILDNPPEGVGSIGVYAILRRQYA